MKPTIAAALASWILLAPPMDLGWGTKFDPSAPMSQWFVVNTYQTAGECNLVRSGRIAGAMRALDNAKDPRATIQSPFALNGARSTTSLVKRQRRHKLLIWAYLWECVASDDPQLSTGK